MITLAANIAYSSAKKMRKAATVNRSNRTSHCTSMAEICKEEEVVAHATHYSNNKPRRS